MDLEYCTGIPKSDLDKKTKLLLSIKDNRLYNMRDNFCTNPKTTFQSCLTLLTQHDTMFGKRSRNSQVNSNKGDRNGKGPGKVPETFKGTKITQIPDEEWYALSSEQKKKIRELRREYYSRNPRNRNPKRGTLQGGRPQRNGGTPGGTNQPGGRRVNLQETDRDNGEETDEIIPPMEGEEEPVEEEQERIPTLGEIFGT